MHLTSFWVVNAASPQWTYKFSSLCVSRCNQKDGTTRERLIEDGRAGKEVSFKMEPASLM